jgi:DNA gyrase inhibitor GyrI
MVNRIKICFVLFVLCVVGISSVFAVAPSGISIRETKEEVVLYTIHRGNYDKIGQVVGNLYALAGKKGISPRGSAYYVYLNNPNQLSSQHWLTEIRIPVSKDAMKAAGTLEKMTDIKILPDTKVAVVTKPKGQDDPSEIYSGLYVWIYKKGYIACDSPREVFPNAMGKSYAQMETEIAIPIQKLQKQEDKENE